MNALLVIDCAFSEALIALRAKGVERMRSFGPQRSHALRLVSEIQLLLEELELRPEQVTRIGIGQGPGSFTGLRVALATGNGMATASGADLVGFSTFDALPVFEGAVLHAFDARRGMVYGGLRQGERWLEPTRVRTVAEAVELGRRADSVFGDAPSRYPELAEGLTVLDGPYRAAADRALMLSAAAPSGEPVLPTYKEGAQAQRLFGTPQLGRALDGDELKAKDSLD